MRSKLFVPASRPELFDKALASEQLGISRTTLWRKLQQARDS